MLLQADSILSRKSKSCVLRPGPSTHMSTLLLTLLSFLVCCVTWGEGDDKNNKTKQKNYSSYYVTGTCIKVLSPQLKFTTLILLADS